jgi:HAD superfamily hydrolase (TIGR01459 family)
MPRAVARLSEVARQFGAVVLDQWGVLHDGTRPYPGAVSCVAGLAAAGVRLAVLSNSGKRAAPNAARIAAMGFDPAFFSCVMTSGEALWSDLAAGRVRARSLCPVERSPGDAADWASGLDVALTDDPKTADAVLLMGLPDAGVPARALAVLDAALTRGLPVLCTNPDRASPRAGGALVASPGALAAEHAGRGGDVRLYGKPHLPVFRAVESALGLGPDRLLMVGDSLEHDIAGGAGAGWGTALVRGGLHAAALSGPGWADRLPDLARAEGAPLPDLTLARLE